MDTKTVARCIRDRRLGLFATIGDAARAADVGTTLWGLMETKGQLPKNGRKRLQVSLALGWPPAGLDNLAAGVDPSTVTPPGTQEGPNPILEAIREVRQEQAGLAARVEDLAAKVDRVLAEGSRSQGAGRSR